LLHVTCYFPTLTIVTKTPKNELLETYRCTLGTPVARQGSSMLSAVGLKYRTPGGGPSTIDGGDTAVQYTTALITTAGCSFHNKLMRYHDLRRTGLTKQTQECVKRNHSFSHSFATCCRRANGNRRWHI